MAMACGVPVEVAGHDIRLTLTNELHVAMRQKTIPHETTENSFSNRQPPPHRSMQQQAAAGLCAHWRLRCRIKQIFVSVKGPANALANIGFFQRLARDQIQYIRL